jgi:hypothetical protein
VTVNDNFANISSEAGDSPQSRGLKGLHQSFDQGRTEELGQPSSPTPTSSIYDMIDAI